MNIPPTPKLKNCRHGIFNFLLQLNFKLNVKAKAKYFWKEKHIVSNK